MPTHTPRRLASRLTLALLLALALLAARQFLVTGPRGRSATDDPAGGQAHAPGLPLPPGGIAGVAEAAAAEAPPSVEDLHQRQASGVTVELEGTVLRHLRDEVGVRHLQRFVVQLASQHVVVVVRDLDRAARVPVKAGDTVQVRGRYVWSEAGGIIHWTHGGPGSPEEGGWILHGGRTYR